MSLDAKMSMCSLIVIGKISQNIELDLLSSTGYLQLITAAADARAKSVF
jgi:hypothetical protein